jgi:hypothetical protein
VQSTDVSSVTIIVLVPAVMVTMQTRSLGKTELLDKTNLDGIADQKWGASRSLRFSEVVRKGLF